MLIADKAEDLLLVLFFEGPPLRQKRLVKDVRVLCLEAHSLHDLAKDSAPIVALHDSLTSELIHFLEEGRRVQEAGAHEVLSQFDLLLYELG